MKIEVVAFVMVLIDFCLSVACVAMGALHLNECQNQAATFLLVNGGVTLALTLIVIALIILYRTEAGQVINLSFCVLSLVKMVLSINGSIAIFGKFWRYRFQRFWGAGGLPVDPWSRTKMQ